MRPPRSRNRPRLDRRATGDRSLVQLRTGVAARQAKVPAGPRARVSRQGTRARRHHDLRALLARPMERSGFAAEHAVLSPVLLWWETNTLRESAALRRKQDFETARSRCLDWTRRGRVG